MLTLKFNINEKETIYYCIIYSEQYYLMPQAFGWPYLASFVSLFRRAFIFHIDVFSHDLAFLRHALLALRTTAECRI